MHNLNNHQYHLHYLIQFFHSHHNHYKSNVQIQLMNNFFLQNFHHLLEFQLFEKLFCLFLFLKNLNYKNINNEIFQKN